jgi:plasmid maintenance system killer protein
MDLINELEIILSESFFGNKKNKKVKSQSKTTLNRFMKMKKEKKQFTTINGNKVEVYNPQTPEDLKRITITVNKNYRKIMEHMLKEFYDVYSRSWAEKPVSKNEFVNNLTPESIQVFRTNNKMTDIEIAFDAKDMFLGHWLTVQLDMPSGKPSYTNMYG